MKMLLAVFSCFIAILLACPAALPQSGTETPNAKLYKPAAGERNWGALINQNFDKIDSSLAINVKAKCGAVGNGVTDDTAAINACLSVASDGQPVFFPLAAPCYKTTATLTISNKLRPHIFGPGAICPTTALAGLPVLEVVDSRDGVIEQIKIEGNSGGPPAALIRFRVSNSPTIAPTQMKVRDVVLGSAAANSMVDGIDFVAGASDQNNELATLERVIIVNCSGAGVSIEHSNSLIHRIIGGNIDCASAAGSVGVKTSGGSFVIVGTNINVGDVDFEIAGVQQHAIEIIGVHSESASKTLRMSSTNTPDISFIGYAKKGSTASTNTIDVTSADARFSMVASRIETGQAGTKFRFTDAGTVAVFQGNTLGFVEYDWAGTLSLSGNKYLAGSQTLTPGASAKLYQFGERGGTGIGDLGIRLRRGTKTLFEQESTNPPFFSAFSATADILQLRDTDGTTNRARIFSNANGDSQVQLNAATARSSSISFATATAEKWSLQNATSQNFILIDVSASGTPQRLTFNTGGQSIYRSGQATDTHEFQDSASNYTGVRLGTLYVVNGVKNDQTGFKHARVTTGVCATGGCDVTVTWGGSAFANTNYTVTCSVQDATSGNESGLQVERVSAISTTAITVKVANLSGGNITGTVHCTAIHD